MLSYEQHNYANCFAYIDKIKLYLKMYFVFSS